MFHGTVPYGFFHFTKTHVTNLIVLLAVKNKLAVKTAYQFIQNFPLQ